MRRCHPERSAGSPRRSLVASLLGMTRSLKTMLRRRITAVLHRSHVTPDRTLDVLRALHEVLHEARLATERHRRRHVEDVLQHQDLAVDVGACADADDRRARLARDALAQRGGNALE